MIEVNDLVFNYSKDKEILHRLNFTVNEGEIFGFLGPNGSGKSTTQKILTGLLTDYSGSVKVLGEKVKKKTKGFFEKIGVLFEFPYLYNNLNALDNLNYFASFYPEESRRDVHEGNCDIIQYDSGSAKLNQYKYDLSTCNIQTYSENDVVLVGKYDRDQKLRREMSCEVLFFEIAAIGFLGVAAILFKEKSMGTIKIHGILPLKRNLFILSKVIVFFVHDIIFSVLLVFCNVGINKGSNIYGPMIIQVIILSALMTLLGFLCATYFKNIKQFTFAYLFISLCMITPVFLEVNTSLSFSFMKFYPVFYLYQGLKYAFWGKASSVIYYFIATLGLIAIFLFDGRRLQKILVKED